MTDLAALRYGLFGSSIRNHIINGAIEIAQRLTPALSINGVHFQSSSNGCIVGGQGTVSYIATTTDGGSVWTTRDSTAGANILRSVFFINSTTGWACGDGGIILKTTDSGVTWTAQTSGVATALNSIFFTSSTQGWAVGASGVIRTTSDGGSNWTAQTSGVAITLRGVFFTSSSQGWAVGDATAGAGVIRVTTDGGANWTAQTSGTTQNIRGVFFTSSTQGWVVGGAGTIRTTSDGGANWTGQTSGTANTLNSLYFVSSSIGWACGSSGTVLSTSNGGSSWTVQTFNEPQAALNSIWFTSSTAGLIGSDAGLNKSTDGGVSWTAIVPSPQALTLPTSGDSFLADRFSVFKTSGWSGKYEVVEDAPSDSLSGFHLTRSIKVTNGTGSAGASSDQFSIRYKIEGIDYAELHGKEIRLQFWVKISVAGTYSVGFENNGQDRSYIGTFAISGGEINTWVLKYIDLTLDNSGTWLFNNGKGLVLYWVLDSGSDFESATVGSWKSDNKISSSSQVSWAGTTGATFQLTGIAMYKGPIRFSLPFSRSGTIVDELRRCQRYCYTEFNNPFDGTFPRTNDIPNSGSSQIALAAYHSSSVYMYVSKFPVFMRITPSATFGLVNTFPASYVQQDSGTTYNVSSFSLQHASKDQAIVNLNTAPNGAIAVSFLRRNHSLSHVLYWRFDAEL